MRRIAVLGLALAACGGANADRFDLTTPGAHTGVAAAPLATPTPTPTVHARPVTRAEKRVIKGWADSLRAGRVDAAARYFAVPSLVANQTPYAVLSTREDAVRFNSALPCGATLLRTRRGEDGFVVADFRLTERPNAPAPCGAGAGATATVAFFISQRRIGKWVRVDGP